MAKFNTAQSFADGDTVTGAKLNNITSQLNIYTGVISEQTAIAATVSTADQLLIADTDNGDSGAANRVTVQKLLNDTLTNGTYTNAQLSGNLNVVQLSTLGTISSTNGTIATLNSTTGTITGLNTTTGTVATLNSTTGTIATLNSTTGTIAGLNSTNGTVATLNSTTGTIANLRSTTGTVATLNSTTGTITGLSTTTGTVGTLNSTTGTITGLSTTTGTVATLNSTTGTITNLSTTLAGDFTISQGTGTIGAAKITPAKLSQPLTSATVIASTSGTAIDFTSIPSWAKRITVMFNEVSTSGASSLLLQMGTSSGILNTGYVGMAGLSSSGGANSYTGITAGIPLGYSIMSAAVTNSGSLQITNLSANIWTVNGSLAALSLLYLVTSAGVKDLGATLDRIRITTVNGSDTFDGGSINIMYEG